MADDRSTAGGWSAYDCPTAASGFQTEMAFAFREGRAEERAKWENDDLVLVADLPDLIEKWKAAGRAERDAEIRQHIERIRKLVGMQSDSYYVLRDLLDWFGEPTDG